MYTVFPRMSEVPQGNKVTIFYFLCSFGMGPSVNEFLTFYLKVHGTWRSTTAGVPRFSTLGVPYEEFRCPPWTVVSLVQVRNCREDAHWLARPVPSGTQTGAIAQ